MLAGHPHHPAPCGAVCPRRLALPGGLGPCPALFLGVGGAHRTPGAFRPLLEDLLPGPGPARGDVPLRAGGSGAAKRPGIVPVPGGGKPVSVGFLPLQEPGGAGVQRLHGRRPAPVSGVLPRVRVAAAGGGAGPSPHLRRRDRSLLPVLFRGLRVPLQACAGSTPAMPWPGTPCCCCASTPFPSSSGSP